MGGSWVGWWAAGALAALGAVAGWLAVALVRARRLQRRTLEDRRRLLEGERESAARIAVEEERARIARELHDIVSHNVALMVVQASAAREVLATLPEEAATAMEAVESAGRDTMTELRHLLGLLAPSPSGEDEPYAAELSRSLRSRVWAGSVRWSTGSPSRGCRSRYGSRASRGRCRPGWT